MKTVAAVVSRAGGDGMMKVSEDEKMWSEGGDGRRKTERVVTRGGEDNDGGGGGQRC